MRPRFSLVFFDVDSTLVTIEGIDVLAGGRPEIVQLTDAAMEGRIPIDEVYARRLEIIRPCREAIDALGQKYLASMTPGASEIVSALREARVDVHLVSAGIEQAISPLAGALGLGARALHAVRLVFDELGAYRDFDRHSPLTRSGGKELVVRDIRARSKGKAALIGDGVTDAEAKPAVDLFIGFGGVTIRPRVQQLADAFIEGPSLEAVLPLLFEND